MKKLKEGFTLIELLVVISLIGILSTLILANLNAARERGRDATRKSDLKNIQTALRLYYNDYGKYPDSGSNKIIGCGTNGTTACEWNGTFAAGSQTYMSKLPSDPLPNVTYLYERIDLDTFTIKACLENKSDDKGVVDQSASWCASKAIYTVQP